MSLIATWSLVIGVLLISMTLVGSAVERLPITPAIIYLAVGYLLGGTRLHPSIQSPMRRSSKPSPKSLSRSRYLRWA